ncbi:hypothetical protein ACXZ1K_18145 [Pedobacter sp. PWIIR3]
MKKFLTLAAVLIIGFSANKAKAQNAPVTLNVVLAGVQTITASAASVSINLSTAPDYLNGKSSGAITDHLTISSTGLFTISVKASGALTSGTPANDIPLNAVKLTPTFGSSTTTLTGPVLNTMDGTLTTSDQAFIKATNGTTSAKYAVDYMIKPGTASANLINRPAGTYATTITYTITPN